MLGEAVQGWARGKTSDWSSLDCCLLVHDVCRYGEVLLPAGGPNLS